MGKRYTVQFERDEDGAWVAVIDLARGKSVIADGRSIGEARKRVRGALAVYLEDDKAAEAAELVDDVKLPAKVKTAVAKALAARQEAQAAQARALESSAAVARELTALGVSTRDAAEMLGVSHQAVFQYAAGSVENDGGAGGRAVKKRAAKRRAG
jgi:predicted RNase H-like HicB family nuclease